MARCPRFLLLLALFVGACGEAAAPTSLRGAESAASGANVVSGPCVLTGSEVCFNATDDNCNGLIDEGCGVRTGQVQFVAAWSEPNVDVDLEVIDPYGEAVEVGHVSQSGLTLEQDCPGKQQLCYGQNYENVYLESGPPTAGPYRVTVRLAGLAGAEPPIVVRLGARIADGSQAYLVELGREGAGVSKTFVLSAVSGNGPLGVGSTERGTDPRQDHRR
jgi:tRNA (guanosine-2'-O-)-methyltransferase